MVETFPSEHKPRAKCCVCLGQRICSPQRPALRVSYPVMSKTFLSTSQQAQHSTSLRRTLTLNTAQNGARAAAAAPSTFTQHVLLNNKTTAEGQQCHLLMKCHFLAIRTAQPQTYANTSVCQLRGLHPYKRAVPHSSFTLIDFEKSPH